MPLLLLALVLLGILLLWASRRRQRQAGLPSGRVIYFDTEDLQRSDETLYDPVTDLAGRPDYIVRRSGQLVPVEVKSGRTPSRPHLSHVLQLAAYCRLIQAVYGQRPPFGVIKYERRAFAVDYEPSLENDLMEVLTEMRRRAEGQPDRSHDAPGRCRACGYRDVCDQRLA